MSLKIWLPLNGNTNNYGLDDPNMTFGGTLAYVDGKMGKSASFNGNNIKIPYNYVATGQMSFCLWVKPNSTANWSDILSFGGAKNRIEKSSNTTYYYFADSSANLMSSDMAIYNLDDNQWYHIAMTCDGVNVRYYLNGLLVRTYPQLNSISTVFVGDPNIYICSRSDNNNNYISYLNDIRIYDHCLSDKEIYEISRGLALHYPLESQYECGLVNKYSGIYADGCSSGGYLFTKSELTTERGYKYILSYTGTGSDLWANINFPNFSFTPNKTYYFSCKIRINHNDGVQLQFRQARWNNDWGGRMLNVTSPSDQGPGEGIWKEYGRFLTIPATAVSNGSTYTCNPMLQFYTNDLWESGKKYYIDFDLKDVQVVECDTYVPFINNEMISDVIEDASGFYNNSIGYSNIVLTNDTTKFNEYNAQNVISSNDIKQYDNSYKFNGNDSYILFNNPINASTVDFSISVWIKLNRTGYSETICCMREVVGYGVGLFKLETDTFRFDCGNTNTHFTDYIMTSLEWTLVTVTRSQTYKKLYINGELKQTVETSGAMNNVYPIGCIGRAASKDTIGEYCLSGNISDFRIYSTCLTDDDVKALYNTKYSLDNKSIFYCRRIIESQPNILYDEHLSLLNKTFSDSLNKFTQTNCQVTLTDNGYRIYRPANLTIEKDGSTMFGGLMLKNPGHWLSKGHTYILLFNVKGKSRNKVTEIGWTNDMSWAGGGLVPTPSNVSHSMNLPENFDGEKLCYYKFTINDDIYKVCTSSYSSFVAGQTYLSYRDFQFGFGYNSTGDWGTDIYISNIRMYDITELINTNFNINSVLCCISVLNGNDKFSIGKYGEIYTSDIMEI